MRGDARLTDFRTDRVSGLVGMVDSSVHFGVKLPKVVTGYTNTKTIRVRGLPPAARIEYYFPNYPRCFGRTARTRATAGHHSRGAPET